MSAIVFMVASSAIFSLETVVDQQKAEDGMRGAATHLASQLTSSDDEGTLAVDPTRLLAGYSVELNGQVVVTDRAGTILATNDPNKWPVGGSFAELSGYHNEYFANNPELAGLDGTCLVLEALSKADEAESLQVPGADGKVSADPLAVFAASYGAGYVAAMRHPDMIYATRFGTMVAATLLAALLIAAIAALANALLRRMVVQHINETNP